jgi:ferritin-like metal-binding protein YciE
MTKTASAAALLHVALQDLHAGKAMQVERLGQLVEAVRDADLKRVLTEEHARAAVQQARLEGVADVSGAPENLWMKGVLDDAERDTQSHEPGKLVDVAVIGAVRKGKAAEIVSSETALALATGEAPAMVTALGLNRAEEIATDRALRARLLVLTGADAGLF